MNTTEGISGLNQVRSLAEKARVDAQNMLDGKVSGPSFKSTLDDAISKVNELQNLSGQMKKSYALGDESVSLAETMITAQRSGLAFEATVQVRNKLVQAYKDIMSMPL